MRRHDLAFVRPESWRATLATRSDLADEPLLAAWVDKGWPLIGRRAMPSEAHGVPLGLPLPPSAGKRRLCFLMQPGDIVSTAPPPSLREAAAVAPVAWRPTLDRLAQLASQHSAKARVFGSLAWRALTGLEYLSESSDLDLLLRLGDDTDVRGLAAGLAAIETTAPMRLDGELVRDGSAVNWRELHAGESQVLVKTIGGVTLIDTHLFVAGGVVS